MACFYLKYSSGANVASVNISNIGCKAIRSYSIIDRFGRNINAYYEFLVSVSFTGNNVSALCKGGRRSVTGLKIRMLKTHLIVALNPSKSSNNIAIINTFI